MSGLSRKLLLLLVACVAFRIQPAPAQNFIEIPAAKFYRADNTYVQPNLLTPNGDYACERVIQKFNANQAGQSQWVEYANAAYITRPPPNNDSGCRYDLIYHGGYGGYPEGHVWGDLFALWWVWPEYQCPSGYGLSSATNPDSSIRWKCSRGAIAESKPNTCPVTVANPISCNTGKKVQVDRDATFGGISLDRIFRSGSKWPTGQSATGVFGEGWYSILTVSLSFAQPTLYSGPAVYAFRPDGTTIPFLLDANSTWKAEQDLRANRLTEVLDTFGARIGWALDTPQGLTEIYDTKGGLIAIEKDDVTILTFQRDQAGRALGIVDRSGRRAQINYDNKQRIDSIDLPDGEALQYAYDSSNRMVSATRSGAEIQYEYVSISGLTGAFLSKIIDEGNIAYAEFGYDTNGKANLSKHAGNVDVYSLVYRNGGNDVDVVFPSGRTETYSFGLQMATRKLVSSSLSCVGCPVTPASQSYDANGFLDVVTDRSGITTDHDYDARDLEVQRVEAANDSGGKKRKLQTDWDAVFRIPLERRTYDAANALVGKSTWAYNSRGQALIATQTDPVTTIARTATTAYCEAADITAGTCPLLGLITSINGPRTDATDTATYTYYASDDASCTSAPTTCPHRKGDLWKVTDALGRITETQAYDGAGRPLSIKDANGIVTDMEYHARGWLIARKVRGTNNAVETDDQITQIEYWPTGLVKKVTQPDGAFTAYTYDAAHRLTDIADNAGNTIHYTLDNAGNRTAEATKDSGSTLRRSLSRVYNQLGQLQTAKDAYNHATGFTYDANGNNQLVTDALSRVTDNDYDPLNRLARTLQDVGGIAAETKFEYDALDNLTKVTDPKGLDTTYQYNGFGDLTQLASPDTGTTLYTYDSAGNRKTQTDARGIVSTYSYDALNRLTGIAYPTSSLNVGYIYDTANPVCIAGETFAIGRLTQMTDSSGDTQYCYDRFGNLTRKVQTTNGHVFELRYAYTLAGQLQAITYPDGAIVDYVRDGQGRITEVGATPAGGTRQILLNQATYHPFGPVASWVYGNGRTMSRPLNQNYQPTAVADNATGGLSLGYEFDAVGNLSKLYNADQSVTKAQYVYDALNRLADVKDGPTGTVIEHYGYDATGNRTSFTNAGGTTSYTYPGTNHRLTQVGVTARTYDNVGNTIQVGGAAKEFVYNDAGHMSQVKVSGTTTMNYQLNGKGEQVRKYLNTNNTYTVYDEAGHWVGDYDSTGATIQQAAWFEDLPVGLLAGATTSQKLHYLEPDHLGTPRAVVDTTANTAIWRWELEGEVFGNTVPNQDPDENGIPFVLGMRYPGQRYDAIAGLHYNYFRNYDPSIGRYAESDPIGLKGGIASYAYVKSRPMNSSDPTGQVHTSGFTSRDFETKVMLALMDAREKIKNCKMPDCYSGLEPYHMSEADRQYILDKLLTMDIVYDPTSGVCGSTPMDQNGMIKLGPSAFNESECGPLSSTIAHEANHLDRWEIGQQGRDSETRSRYIEKICFGYDAWGVSK